MQYGKSVNVELHEVQRAWLSFVELASHGIDIIITIDGTPKARLTSVEPSSDSQPRPITDKNT
jgi:hypothetical protein